MSRPSGNISKNQQIKTTLLATRERRKHMICKTYELKIVNHHLPKYALLHLHQLFLEAKWFSNAIIGSKDIFSFDSKIESVSVICPDTIDERPLTHLSSQMKQSLVKQVQRDIISLKKQKEKGHLVGKLIFKKCVETIPLKQHGNTYTVKRPNKSHIQGLKGYFKVRGLHQVPKDAELAEAKLRYISGDFYLLVTCYLPITSTSKKTITNEQQKQQKRVEIAKQVLGIDGGIANQLTLSNGIQITYNIQIPEKLSQLCKRLSKKKYASKKYVKTKIKLQKRYKKWTNRKIDTTNKIISRITNNYAYVAFQDDSITNWQRLWGTRLLNTALGRLFTTLERRVVSSCVIDKWEPTSKRCSDCGYILLKQVPLDERVFQCLNPECRLELERDWNASIVDKKLSIGELASINSEINHRFPQELRKKMPLETSTSIQELCQSLDRLPFVSAQVLSMKREALSFRLG
ncbi:MAG: hypothetical protein HeimC3_15190 [Candidatus Heimdallarchaeota archaeon LC_3]|nr:MAG: hypothetical protein HeimC3_15190 [Candidatus Heimdallarchaeota archaeon LC_3]